MSELDKLFGKLKTIIVETAFCRLDLSREEQLELGEALALICAEHINAQMKRK